MTASSSDERIGMTVAPILKWRGFDFPDDEFEIAEGLHLVRKPEIELGESLEKYIGDRAVKDMRSAEWALRHIYQADGKSQSASEAKKSRELIQMAVLSMWITKPTRATLEYCIGYHHAVSDLKRASGVVRPIGLFAPHLSFQKEVFTEKDAQELRNALTEVRTVYDEKRSLSRTLNYLHAALHSLFHDASFMMFSIVLESLFSTSYTELAHKVSERVAFFLEEEKKKRRELFTLVKKLYEVRSTIAHGGDVGKLKMSDSELNKMLADLQLIVQRTIRKVILDKEMIRIFSGKNDKREAYFADLLFS